VANFSGNTPLLAMEFTLDVSSLAFLSGVACPGVYPERRELTLSVIEGKGYSFFITLVHFIIVGRILRLRLLNPFMWKSVLALSRVRMSGLAELILILFIDNE